MVRVYRDGIKTPRGLLSALRAFLSDVAIREGMRVPVSVIITGEKRMAYLNETFKGRRGPTDVLAFPDERYPEVYLSWEEAERRGHGPRECARLALHGLLHLAGYDHETRESAERMRLKEEDYLSCWSF
ncbi:MAG: rRNA maturation RNase YbeY [candidate division WOR-3 bacterium]